MKPIAIFIITLAALYAGSFLLDIEQIKESWLRYGLVIVLLLSIAALGFRWSYDEIKKL